MATPQIIGKQFDSSALKDHIASFDSENLNAFQAILPDADLLTIELYVGITISDFQPNSPPEIKAVKFKPYALQFSEEDIPLPLPAVANIPMEAQAARSRGTGATREEVIEFQEPDPEPDKSFGFTFFSLDAIRAVVNYSEKLVFSGATQRFGRNRFPRNDFDKNYNYFNIKLEGDLKNPPPLINPAIGLAAVSVNVGGITDELIGLPALQQGQPCPPIWEPPEGTSGIAMLLLQSNGHAAFESEGGQITIPDNEDSPFSMAQYQFSISKAYRIFAFEKLARIKGKSGKGVVKKQQVEK